MQTITNTPITETLLNKSITQAEQYFKSDFDRLTKQIEVNKEYYQLYIKNEIITKILNMKER
jgi:hypothetical protein